MDQLAQTVNALLIGAAIGSCIGSLVMAPFVYKILRALWKDLKEDERKH